MRRANTQSLLRDTRDNLFTWSKQGIILKKGHLTINLNELELETSLDILEGLLDSELTYTQRLDVTEVKNYFKEILENR